MKLSWLLVLVLGCSEYQISGEEDTDSYYVPNPLPLPEDSVTDKFIQTTLPEVDVLWVIDNSGSMLDDQEKLIEHFPAFMDYLIDANINYHIGVTAIDPIWEGRLNTASDGMKWVDLETEDPQATFAELALIGANGFGFESGRLAVWNALHNEYNDGFFRDEASLHTIVITDDNDQSRFPDSKYVSREEDEAFVEWFESIKLDREQTTFSGIVPSPKNICSHLNPYASWYFYPIRRTEGVGYDFCKEDWVPALKELGLETIGYMKAFPLSRFPVVETIEVKVVIEGATLTSDWEYDQIGNSITLSEVAPEGSEVYITYSLLR